MKKSIAIALSLLTLTGISTQADASASQTDSQTLNVTQGYSKGATTLSGTVKGTQFYAPDVSRTLSNMRYYSDTTLFDRANSNARRNYVITTDNYVYPASLNNYTLSKFNSGYLISPYKLNQEFLKLINAERSKYGLRPVRYGIHLQAGADRRSQTVATNGNLRINGVPHVNADGSPYYTAHHIADAKYRIGENQALSVYNGNPYTIVSEKYIAEQIFTQWKNSPSHYQNMLSPSIKSVAVSSKFAYRNTVSPKWNVYMSTLSTDNRY